MYGGPQLAYGATQLPQYIQEGDGFAVRKVRPPQKRRINVVAVMISVSLPWIVFCLFFAMCSFRLHFTHPKACEAIASVAGALLAVLIVVEALGIVRSFADDQPKENGLGHTWSMFIFITSLGSLAIGIYYGYRNFWMISHAYYDITYLNNYTNVQPELQRGQEFMDAGFVTFNPHVTLDLTKASAFKNGETFCVAPITVNGTSLNSYDFWAVGKNCCSGTQAADWTCGSVPRNGGKGGVRVVGDSDRAFFRLAVQQAQSAYAIRANHPLFFHWVSDPTHHIDGLRRQGYSVYLIGMIVYLAFQLVLVIAYTSLVRVCLQK
jgi:hypothetical protein